VVVVVVVVAGVEVVAMVVVVIVTRIIPNNGSERPNRALKCSRAQIQPAQREAMTKGRNPSQGWCEESRQIRNWRNREKRDKLGKRLASARTHVDGVSPALEHRPELIL
jgi:hypothetical protein